MRIRQYKEAAFDDRIAIVGTAGSGKTYAAKGFVERLLESGARFAIVDPLGVWWVCARAPTAARPVIPRSCSAASTSGRQPSGCCSRLTEF
jgi:hypothetical protein